MLHPLALILGFPGAMLIGLHAGQILTVLFL